MLASKLVGVIASYLMHPFRPRFTLTMFGELMGFSRWMLLNNVASFFRERVADFLVGRWYGSAFLGIYSVGYELATLPVTELSAPINRALLPGFAKMQSAGEVNSAYENALGILALVSLPAAAGMFAVAPYLVHTMLGVKWLEAIPFIEVLALNGAIVTFTHRWVPY
jgi:lipopolysaccharide exporter